MKLITRAFLVAELLDLATTGLGLTLPGVVETNPVGLCVEIIFAKAAVIVAGCAILQNTRVRLAWIVPAIAALPVAWNVTVIAAEILG